MLNYRKLVLLVLLIILLGSGCGNDELVLMTYNIRAGRGLDGNQHLDEIAAVIRRTGAAIVALQEVDSMTVRSGKIDQARALAQKLGMQAIFAANIDFDGGRYGTAILCKGQILTSDHSLLPNAAGLEQRGVQRLYLVLGRDTLAIFNTHLEYASDSLRYVQAEAVRSLVARENYPTILMGDFNDTPASRPVSLFRQDFYSSQDITGDSGFTFPASAPARTIDFIFLRRDAGLEFKSARIPQSQASDHLPVIGIVQLN